MPKNFMGTPDEWRLLQIHRADALWISQHVKLEADTLDEDLLDEFAGAEFNDLAALSDTRRLLYQRQAERRRKAEAQRREKMGDPQTEEEKAAAIEKANREAREMDKREAERLERERVRKDAEEAAQRRDKSYGDD